MRSSVIVVALAVVGSSQAASFDCRRAESRVEKLICETEAISKLDDDLAAVYKQRLADEKRHEDLKRAQRAWLKQRNACADVKCLSEAYQARLWQFATPRSPAANGPYSSRGWVSCNPQRLTITVVGGTQPKAMQLEYPREIDLDALLTSVENVNGWYFPTRVALACKLGSAEYQLTLWPWMKSYNPMGECGAEAPYLGLALLRNGSPLLPWHFGFSENCGGAGSIKYMVFSEQDQTVTIGYFETYAKVESLETADISTKVVPFGVLNSKLDINERDNFLLRKGVPANRP